VRVKQLWEVVKAAARQFVKDNLWVQAAALSYYTIFAPPAILLIILRSTLLVYEQRLVESTLFGLIRETVGKEIDVMGEYLSSVVPKISYLLLQFFSFVVPIVLITLLFAAIFRFLPDAQLAWSEVWAGALLTTLLFSIGRYLIDFYIDTISADSLYQAAGSVMIIMLWSFYASIIFLFGAAFTHH